MRNSAIYQLYNKTYHVGFLMSALRTSYSVFIFMTLCQRPVSGPIIWS